MFLLFMYPAFVMLGFGLGIISTSYQPQNVIGIYICFYYVCFPQHWADALLSGELPMIGALPLLLSINPRMLQGYIYASIGGYSPSTYDTLYHDTHYHDTLYHDTPYHPFPPSPHPVSFYDIIQRVTTLLLPAMPLYMGRYLPIGYYPVTTSSTRICHRTIYTLGCRQGDYS